MYRIIVYLGLQQCCVHRCVTVCCPLIVSRLKYRLLHTNSCRHTTLKFQPNHWIVVRKHFRTLTTSFTQIHKLWKYQFAKEKFPHSFSLLLSLSLFFIHDTRGRGWYVCCAREISGTAMSFRTWNCATTEWPAILLLLRCTAAPRHGCSHVTGLRIG